jgi:hypothetical protein
MANQTNVGSIWARVALIAPCCVFVTCAADTVNGLAEYKAANYKAAIPLLQVAARANGNDPVIAAALLSALVYEGRVDEASDAAQIDASRFPTSPEVNAARGEFAFYMGDMREAETLFKTALKLKEDTPRALYGLSRLCRISCMYRSARLLCLKAHEIDPDDALITSVWLRYVTEEKRKELLGPFVAAHPWLYQHFERGEQTSSEIKEELNGRKPFELLGQRTEATLPLIYLRNDATHVRGVGLELAIEGGKRLTLLFDTGATGILITQAAVDRAGLNHLGSFEARGLGDKGAKNAFASVADNCAIGPLKYRTCVFNALEGKGRVAGENDGLIGADFFSGYTIQVDFQRRLLHLTPQPDRPPNPQGYDRTIPPEEAGFTPVFRAGGHLYVSTKVNGTSTGLFLLDTGSQQSNIDSTFARLSTKIHGNAFLHVKGLSGEVKDVFEADKAELQFAHFRQANLGLTALNLNNVPEHQEFRMAGIFGIPLLSMFRLTIDYRNGLVNFDYVLK